MFGLDKVIFYFVYKHCLRVGSSFGFGAFEGFIMYFMAISSGIIIYFEKRTKR